MIKQIVYGKNLGVDRAFVRVDLAEAAPKGAVIAVISRVDGAKRIPLSWSNVPGNGSLQLPIWHTPFTCEPHIDALIAPQPGNEVEVMWLDTSGRVSEASKAATVARAKAPK